MGVRIPAAVSSSSSGSGGGGTSSTNGLSSDQHLFTIACSPYESRRDSAYISGSIIEVGPTAQAEWRLLGALQHAAQGRQSFDQATTTTCLTTQDCWGGSLMTMRTRIFFF